MIAWINFAVLLVASLLFLYFYVRSVSPAGTNLVLSLGIGRVVWTAIHFTHAH